MKQINGINIANINNAAHIMYVRYVIEAAEENESVAADTGEKLARLKAAWEEESSLLGRSRKSSLTAGIAAADIARDQLYKAYRRCVNAYKHLPDKATADAANALATHMKSYQVDTAAQLDCETGGLHRFVESLQEQHADKLQLLSLTPLVEAMAKQSDTVNRLQGERDEERAGWQRGAMKAAKRTVSTLYRDYVATVNALAIVNGPEAYAPFIDYVNEVISRFKRNELG